MAEQTQTYYAKSLFSDPQNIASAISLFVGILALPEVSKIIPVAWMPAILAISSALNLILRTAFGVRPVAAIAPGDVKPVRVATIEATLSKDK